MNFLRPLLHALLPLTLALTCAAAVPAEGDIAKAGMKAPDFTLSSTDGKPVQLGSFKGQVVVVNFFATWCGPCMEELPHVEAELQQALGNKGLVVLAVGREHSVEQLAKFKASKGFTFTILADPKREAYGKYASAYIPRCYVIGKDGKISLATVGFEAKEFAALVNVVKAELAK